MYKIIESPQKIPPITLTSLYSTYLNTHNKLKEGKRSPSSNPCSKNSDIEIRSPFYERIQNKKGYFCKCPFHPCQRFKKIPQLTQRSNIHSSELQQIEEKKKLKTHLTEVDENYGQKYSARDSKKISKYGLEQFEGTSCKVDCRNDKFEEFLRKNDLCILKGLRKRDQQKGLKIEKLNKKHHDQFMKRIMEKVKKQRKWEQQFYDRSTSQIIKMTDRERLFLYKKIKQRVDDDAKQIPLTLQKQTNLKNIDRKIIDLLTLQSIHKKQMINQIHIQTLATIHQVIQIFVNVSNSASRKCSRNKKKRGLEEILKTNEKNSEVKQKQKQQIIQQKSKEPSQTSQRQSVKEQAKVKNSEQESTNQKKFEKKQNIINRVAFRTSEIADFSDQESLFNNFEDDDDLFDTQKSLKSHKKVRRGGKHFNKNLLQKMATEKKKPDDKKIKKLRSQIEKRKSMIKRIQSRLKDDELGKFLIVPTDTLITRKKKLRYLKQNLLQKRRKWQYFDEVMEYVELFKDFNEKMMENKVNNEAFQSQRKADAFLTDRDLRGSLKFIDLQENIISDREKIDEGWIKIQQYTTIDEVKMMNKTSRRQRQQKKISEQNFFQNGKDLVQIDLKNVFSVQDQTGKRRQTSFIEPKMIIDQVSALNKRQIFKKKISHYRQLIFRRNN